MLFAFHVVGIGLVIYEVKRPNPTSWVFRNWYPLPYVASCYKEMAFFIHGVRHSDADQWLSDLDLRIWGVHPTVWVERIYHPILTEFLQVVYTLFIPAVLYICCILWKQGKTREFQYYGFLIALGYLVSYIGYLIVPARGPRFLLSQLQHSAIERIMAVSQHAGGPGQVGIGPLRLFSERPYGTHHPGVVGQPDGLKSALPALFRLHSVHHFCYSLSSIPLYG